MCVAANSLFLESLIHHTHQMQIYVVAEKKYVVESWINEIKVNKDDRPTDRDDDKEDDDDGVVP